MKAKTFAKLLQQPLPYVRELATRTKRTNKDLAEAAEEVLRLGDLGLRVSIARHREGCAIVQRLAAEDALRRRVNFNRDRGLSIPAPRL